VQQFAFPNVLCIFSQKTMPWFFSPF
jgi:hypothetical protein